MTPARFIELMSRDKKVLDGRLRLILLRSIGEAAIADDVGESELTELLGGAPPAA
jgi:3-dehydroquinate synthase